MILRTEGRILFSNAEIAKTQIEELYQANRPDTVLFDLSGVPDIEYTALDMLITGEKKYRENGIEIWFCALNERVLEIFKSSGFFDTLKTDKLFFDVNTGVEKYLSMKSGKAHFKA
jgi:anti-anti-sigma factor